LLGEQSRYCAEFLRHGLHGALHPPHHAGSTRMSSRMPCISVSWRCADFRRPVLAPSDETQAGADHAFDQRRAVNPQLRPAASLW
jgi:hypothetical protein